MKIKDKIVKKKFDRSYLIKLTIMKILIILFLISSFYLANITHENTISLLAVHEGDNNKIISGSKIDLNLKITRGTGQIFVNLNSVEDIDTQVSITNSQKQACDLFNKDCSKYDFTYTFQNSALILKGPSASAAIAILTIKTLEHEDLNQDIVITGALSSGGVIGNVGGVDKKIEVAQNMGFKKIIVPIFSTYNKTKSRNIEVLPLMDIISAYNEFSKQSNQIKLETKDLNTEEYSQNMKILSKLLCDRSENLKSQINFESINTSENSTDFESQFLKTAITTTKNSKLAEANENYYSMASFCYNSNVNYRNIIEIQKNLTFEQRNEELKKSQKEYLIKLNDIRSYNYNSQIKTINDFYVYLIINDRVEQANEFVDIALEIGKEENKIEIIDSYNNTENKTDIININKKVKINNTIDDKIKEAQKMQKQLIHSQAIERFYSVEIWEKLLNHKNNEIKINELKATEICQDVINSINLKSEIIQQYGISTFEEETQKINNLLQDSNGNKYLCIYKGFELNGKIETVLNSIDIKTTTTSDFADEILKIANNRLNTQKGSNFPLIPYIYYEYATELNKVNNSDVAILYSNYAMSYLDLGSKLEITNKSKSLKSFLEEIFFDMFNFNSLSLIFITGMLVILAFLEHDKNQEKKKIKSKKEKEDEYKLDNNHKQENKDKKTKDIVKNKIKDTITKVTKNKENKHKN